MTDRKTVPNKDLFADIERIIDSGGRIQLRVKGNSMKPFLRNERDIVHLSTVSRIGLRRGMVVLFRYSGRHILHRIRRIEGNKAEMKGDGNYRMVEYAPLTEIAAYVYAVERNGSLIRYGSVRWKVLTAWSLWVKALRTLYHDVRNLAGGNRVQ